MQLGEDLASYTFLMRANNISEWLWPIYFKLILLAGFSSASLAVISTLICGFSHDSIETKYLYHPFFVLLVMINFSNDRKSTFIPYLH